MQTIQQHFAENGRYLVIELISGETKLMKADEVFQRPGGPGWVQFVVVDLQEILEKFDKESLRREAFTLSELAGMAQQKGPTVHSWIKAGVLTPSIRDRDGTRGRAMLFSRHDAFVACLVASLKRECGLPLTKLREVSDVLRPSDQLVQPTQTEPADSKDLRRMKNRPNPVPEGAAR